MVSRREVVITGLGVVSPIGLGREAFWQSLLAQTSGVEALRELLPPDMPTPIGGRIRDFDAKQYVTPRKSLKVMSREIQLGFTAARLALEDAALQTGQVEPDRFGVVFGADMIYCEPDELSSAYRSCIADGRFSFDSWGQRAMGELFPLWMLKYLPNMPACHIAIAQDARGPNNTLVLGEVSSLLALSEAVRTIERGQADVMITGGTGCRIHSMAWVFRHQHLFSSRRDAPTRATRPFDAERDGLVYGEGAAAFILESREYAISAGRRPLARVIDYASGFTPTANNGHAAGSAICRTIELLLARNGLTAADVDHVNANGMSTVAGDRQEAQAIRAALGNVPVTALKSYFGNLGAATGAVEMAGSVLAFEHGRVPVTLNYEHPDAECPVNVVHGEPLPVSKPFALMLNQTTNGQAVAVLLGRPD